MRKANEVDILIKAKSSMMNLAFIISAQLFRIFL